MHVQELLKVRSSFDLASLRAVCIADSIMLPEAVYSFGMGTAIRIPDPSLSFVLASAINHIHRKRIQDYLEVLYLLKQI